MRTSTIIRSIKQSVISYWFSKRFSNKASAAPGTFCLKCFRLLQMIEKAKQERQTFHFPRQYETSNVLPLIATVRLEEIGPFFGAKFQRCIGLLQRFAHLLLHQLEQSW